MPKLKRNKPIPGKRTLRERLHRETGNVWYGTFSPKEVIKLVIEGARPVNVAIYNHIKTQSNKSTHKIYLLIPDSWNLKE